MKFKFLPQILLAAMLTMAVAVPVRAQVQNPVLTPVLNLPQWPLAFTNAGGGLAGVSTWTPGVTATNYIPLYINSGLSVQSTFARPQGYGTATNLTGTLDITFFPSVDGTNPISQQYWAVVSGKPNITNAVTFGTNWSQLQLNGFKGMFYTVSNNCSDCITIGGVITNNPGPVTNYYSAGIIFGRPVR
jgi:hypothetical protein